ncbi:ATP-dependent DNA helicase RecQ [Williamsia sp. CHRR-6]|uniref:RecQ family ATP-dependent DNA helicase n=1 Tax=Williamsia sp. CHRR-6 TaxID=2835871 RepID=UPI001BD9B435|nr:DEAD/DEAH box helicase [Williamsia sp. CHRR-6]MBT0565548.1 ATP-dependent DNA helicase RecQ [Williamsia sp. CHRR-6]
MSSPAPQPAADTGGEPTTVTPTPVAAPCADGAGLPASWTSQRARTADAVIVALAGRDAGLRADQRVAVAALSDPGARVLVVQATGWGKSAVYWAATAIRRSEGAGPTLIVSPLLSLMRDQVAAAQRAGLRAATVNSSNIDDWSAIEADLRSGDLDVLLVSPERLANPGFGRRVLDSLRDRLGLLVIDEAHAISDWGHDFRPDYRRVADVLAGVDTSLSVLATTATANARVSADVAAQLGSATLVLRGPLARRSLQLNVIEAMSPIQRYGWVIDHLPTLPGSGIVYVLTVADAGRLVDAITAVHGDQVSVAAYTGQLDAQVRHELEDRLRDNDIKALVATSALGMGYDKPDLGFVVHVGSPPSPVSYYQQVGRAGRAIDHAVVALLPSPADAGIWDHFATATIPDPDQMARVLDHITAADEPSSAIAIEAATGIRRTRVELMLKQLAVDGALDRVEGGWTSTGVPWHHDAEHYAGIIATRKREADIMRAYTRGERCLMALLVESLDDPDAAPCGRCSVCRGTLSDGMTQRPRDDTVRTAAAALRSGAVVLEPRKMWPGGTFGTRGRIPPDQAADPGRVLIHADAPEWIDTLTAARSGDSAAVDEIARAAVSVLSQWRATWSTRPDIVVSLTLTPSPLGPAVAEHLATVGKLARATLEVNTEGSPGRQSSGADEATFWRSALHASPDVAGSCVLLVVDSTSTGWPTTIAAALLRSAGAHAVLPLVIHRPA